MNSRTPFTRIALLAAGLGAMTTASATAEDLMTVGEGGRIRANSWLRLTVPGRPTARPVAVEIVDPWGQTVWTGAASGTHVDLVTRDFADGEYTARFEPGGDVHFEVATEYVEGIRARCGLLLRAIDKQRDPDGMAHGHLRGVSNLLQRIITLHVIQMAKPKVAEQMEFCEKIVGFRTASAAARVLGSGSANFEGYDGPYLPLKRERSCLFVPPDIACDCAAHAERKLARWGYRIGDINHILISHSHADHFDAAAIAAFARKRREAGLPPPVVHSGQVVCRILREHLAAGSQADLVQIDEVRPGEETQAGEATVKAVRANHSTDSDPLCFIICWRGATCYYGTDTSYPPAATYAALASERFDLFAHEITAASADDGRHHCDLGDVLLLTGKLRSAGALDPWSRVVSIHLDVEGVQVLPDYMHHERAVGFECSYDGMPVPIAYRLPDNPPATRAR